MKKTKIIFRRPWVELVWKRNDLTWIEFTLSSGDDENKASFYFRLLGLCFWIRIFPIIPAYKEIRSFKDKNRSGTYTHYDKREFGFCYTDGHVNLCYGRQTEDSRTEKRRGFFVGFLNTTYQGLRYRREPECTFDHWEWLPWSKNNEPKPWMPFYVIDTSDLTPVSCKAVLVQFKYSHGTGRWTWLSKIFADRIVSGVEIEFDGEVGERKESWKGGIQKIYSPITVDPDIRRSLEISVRDVCIQRNLILVDKEKFEEYRTFALAQKERTALAQ